MSETATASAPAPVAAPSNVSTSPAAGLSFQNVMNKVAQNTGVQDAPVEAAPVVKIVKTAPAEAAPVIPASEVPAAETPASEAASDGTTETPASEPEAPAEPIGEIALDDDGITLRAERNGDGTFKTKLDPNQKMDLEFKDKTTGEIRKYTKTMPEILRLAKDGVSLQPIVQQLKPEVEYYRGKLPEWQQKVTTLQTDLDAQMALMHEVFADEATYQARRAQYQQEMSPEKRLARIEHERAQEVETRTAHARQEQLARTANAFITSRIAPEIAKAEAVVGVEAAAGKVMLLTNDLTVKGVIPPANWPEMERRIQSPDGPFQTWLKAETAKRSQSDSEITRKKAELEEQRRKAQQVVNDTGRTIAPVGRAAADTPAALPKPKNTQDAIARMVNRPLPSTVTHAAGTG